MLSTSLRSLNKHVAISAPSFLNKNGSAQKQQPKQQQKETTYMFVRPPPWLKIQDKHLFRHDLRPDFRNDNKTTNEAVNEKHGDLDYGSPLALKSSRLMESFAKKESSSILRQFLDPFEAMSPL